MKDDILKVLIAEEQTCGKGGTELGRADHRGLSGQKPIDGQRAQGLGGLYGRPDARDRSARSGSTSCRSPATAAGAKTSGVVKIVKDLDLNLEGYDLLIVEDILDSGMNPVLSQGDFGDQGSPASITHLPHCSTSPSAGRSRILRPTMSCFDSPGRIRRRLRAGLRGEIPQPALYRRSQTGSLRRKLLSKAVR